MKSALAPVLVLTLAVSALAGQPKVSPDPVLEALKDRLEYEFENLDPKPTFEIPDIYGDHSLTVRFKTRDYVVHPRKSKTGGFAETTKTSEGPSVRGFLLRVQVERLGLVHQLVVPQVIREPYWYVYVNIYPVKNTQKQLYFCLSYTEGTDQTLVDKMKKVAEHLSPAAKK